TADIRSTANLQLNTAGVVIADKLVHLLGGTLQLAGYTGSADLVVLSGVQTVDITGTAQSGRELRLHSGVSAGWSDTQLLTTRPTAVQLAGGSATVRASGVLDAKDSIRIATGASFSLAADAVVSPNLSSVKTPVIVQREKTIDVVVGSRDVNTGTQLVDQITYAPTQVTEQVGTQTVRIGTQYHTMDVQLVQDAYYNGTTVREYFVEQVDYQNIARDWCTAPVVPWASYHVWPDGTVRNIDLSPAEGGQPVPAPESAQTFAQLTDDQRSVVLSVLGYKRLFNFQYANAKTHQTVNGNTTIIPWTPPWRDDRLITVSINAPGLKNKYIRLPEGAREDVLRAVSQGFTTATENVGFFRDGADVRYTQITSRLTDVPPNIEDFDDTIIGWQVRAIEDEASPSGIRDGLREYQLFDDSAMSNVAMKHSSIPLWYGSAADEVGTDTLGQRATAPQGYLADSSSLQLESVFAVRPDVIVGSRRFPEFWTYTTPSYKPDQDWWQFQFASGMDAFNEHHYFNNQGFVEVGPALLADVLSRTTSIESGLAPLLEKNGMPHGIYNNDAYWTNVAAGEGPLFLQRNGYLAEDFQFVVIASRKFVDIFPLPGSGWEIPNPFHRWYTMVLRGRVLYTGDLVAFVREDFHDYDFRWIGKWHDVIDRRENFSFEWVTREQDVFGTVPQFATITKTVPVLQQVEQTVWTSQPIIQQQTVLVTERIEQTGPQLTSAVFENESLRAGARIAIDAGTDASFIGLTRATETLGEILVTAGRDVLLDGARPVGAAADSLAAVADLRAGALVDVSGARNVTMKADAILRADDGNATTQTEVIRLTAGETLTVQSDAFGGHE
ncbi:MAG: hypothetical protein RLZZ436_2128, partial [Planctomycetota bacterium]